METNYKRTVAGSVGAGVAAVFNASGRQYYILEHKTESLYHHVGESQLAERVDPLDTLDRFQQLRLDLFNRSKPLCRGTENDRFLQSVVMRIRVGNPFNVHQRTFVLQDLDDILVGIQYELALQLFSCFCRETALLVNRTYRRQSVSLGRIEVIQTMAACRMDTSCTVFIGNIFSQTDDGFFVVIENMLADNGFQLLSLVCL